MSLPQHPMDRALLQLMLTDKQWHGERMKEARVHYRAHLICPDCYLPASHCQHVNEWAFLRRR